MDKNILKREKREKRHIRIRGSVVGTAARPRLVVYRSLNHIYAQIIDDNSGITLCQASSLEKTIASTKGDKKAKAKKVGEALGKKAVEKGIKKIVFDRNGYKFHGRVKQMADGARKAGLEF
ncbi:MAG: 50S ribosomal protein L18 [bacterium]